MHVARVLWISTVALAACGAADGAPAVDAGVGVDGAVVCTAGPPLELGICMRDGTTPCTGEEGEPRTFVDHVAGGEVPMVLGHQGLMMVVFGARAHDIALGDPDDPEAPGHPALQVLASVDEVPEVARYDGYPAFVDEGGGAATANGLYLVMLASASVLDHLVVDVTATLTDRDGTVRCGATSMELVAAP